LSQLGKQLIASKPIEIARTLGTCDMEAVLTW
jgi:hypothetical protein